MNEIELSKGLEIWTLQTLVNVSIMIGFFALGMTMIHSYLNSLKKNLTLRVSIELWDVIFIIITDFMLALVVLTGFMIFNTDIMSDIKVALPFVPLGTILYAVALTLRLFYGGHKTDSTLFRPAAWLMFAAAALQGIGFSFVMEAPGKEYLATHPSFFWIYIKTHLRSNADPYGLEFAQYTFYVLYPVLIGIFIWGFLRSMKLLGQRNDS